MRVLTEPLNELECYKRAEETLKKPGTSALISGCVDSQKWNMAWGLTKNFRNRIIVTYSDQRVREIYEDLRIYDKNVKPYPAKDVIFYEADVHSNKLTKDRLICLKRILTGLPCTFVTTFAGLMNVGVGLPVLKDSILKLSMGLCISESALIKRLKAMGYEKTYQVEVGGQFSVRGGIVDIFDLTEDNPYRIELWGDEITSLRSFDVESQRSVDRLESVTVYPATELPFSEDVLLDGLRTIKADAKKLTESFRKKTNPEAAHRLELIIDEVEEEITEFPWSFNADSYVRYFCRDAKCFADFFEKACFVVDEPVRVAEHADAVEFEFTESMKARLEKGYIVPGQANVLLSKEEVMAKMRAQNMLMLCTLESRTNGFSSDTSGNVNARSIPSYNGDFPGLLKDLEKYKNKNYRILILSGSRTRAERLAKDLNDNDIITFFGENRDRVLQPGEIETMFGYVVRGFEYPDIKLLVISESDIFGSDKKKKPRKHYEGKRVQTFDELHINDYVVHEHHGVGIYKGIEKVKVEKITKDYMKIEYKDGGILYVPATGLDSIMKFSSKEGKKPKINKLGGQEWAHTTAKVRTATAEVAKELVELYAKRSLAQGFVYDPDTAWQREFEETFPYEETKDQLDAIEATKADMESNKIMDRLICGDVGYGKTEVAIRAAFKAIQSNKQVVFLVPTTILAEQHYTTFTQRMKDFPVRVELLSRFVPRSKQAETLRDLKKGLVDIVIGTHRVLSKDVIFKDLGLLIVDEEQRFGVAHKERIKEMKTDVDVLTLTATPIPRTLHMSLVGIRDMSVLEEAPNERMPIQTYVMEYNEEMVREAINRELGRRGQVYYVYNRVNTIAETAGRIQALVPEANVAFAHGQMKESELERIMYDFIKGDIDVLVSTTIIETGIDIPNVNTMIIHDSDSLGLSQLYQLRGRVGRSNRTAYAFLMYKRDKVLKEVAEKRLQTIRDFTELGSGVKVATRDLEIRGTGNVLGMDQSGHMEAVGYELYCKMLNRAVMKAKGLTVEEDFATTLDLDVDAFISPEYILNEIQKLDTYKRIAALESELEVKEMKEELEDRFGELPSGAENLLKISELRIIAHALTITEIKGRKGKIKFSFLPKANIKTENIGLLLAKHKGRLVMPKGEAAFVYTYYPTGEVLTDENMLLEATKTVLLDMKELLMAGN